MKELYKYKDKTIRVLNEDNSKKILVIDCYSSRMPYWINKTEIINLTPLAQEEIFRFNDYPAVTSNENRIMHHRYTIIAPILPFIADTTLRTKLINEISIANNITHMTVRTYLCKYLSSQDIRSLIPQSQHNDKELTDSEKNYRWALNKYYYTEKRYSLVHAYKMMLKDRYCDESGVLFDSYPKFHQFRYYYQKTKSPQKEAIRREGLKAYQRNYRPLLGEGLRQFAPAIGTGMLDSTVCDLYLINEQGAVIGRPILTTCIDTYSELCCGYSIGWEGGIYSVRNMLNNVVTNKVKHCLKFGINIKESDWPCNQLLGRLITDKGAEYKGECLEQITEVGVSIVNLPSYRPELKGMVEKFFDIIQNYYKPYLFNKGVIRENFQERGAHDYRKDATLTLKQFETILLRCIIYYNSQRIIENFPYTDEMIQQSILPYSATIWNYSINKPGANLITISNQQLNLILLPRTQGRFTRKGLVVNKMRYKNDMYTDKYLEGKNCIVAYDEDNTNEVYLIEKDTFIPFQIIESRYASKSLTQVSHFQLLTQELIQSEKEKQLQAEIDLANHILAISENTTVSTNTDITHIRETRLIEKTKKRHERTMPNE